jgi:hypothetical protein
MAGWTNKGKYQVLGQYFRGETKPTNFYIELVTSAAAPGPDTNTETEMTEIAAGNGYVAGGTSLSFNSTDWDVWTEVDASDWALVQLKDITWSASGGPIPSSGNGARYAIICDDNATQANREIYFYFDLTSDRSVSDGQDLTLQNCEIRITET